MMELNPKEKKGWINSKLLQCENQSEGSKFSEKSQRVDGMTFGRMDRDIRVA